MGMALSSMLAMPMTSTAKAHDRDQNPALRAKNVILFVGDGMGVSTVSATRVLSVGVEGSLVLDQLPYTALSRTADADHITSDSASTMSAMVSGVPANSGVFGFGSETEYGDFNNDGDGPRVNTLIEQAKRRGMKVGVVSTARITHATPAACYAHINDRNAESDIALQALPGDARYNTALGKGLDLMIGGGRQFFVPSTTVDEEGGTGSRTDGRDLRSEFKAAGYSYVWNQAQFANVTPLSFRCSACSSAATWSTSTTARATPAVSRASAR
jgi:alkaline phosphatase